MTRSPTSTAASRWRPLAETVESIFVGLAAARRPDADTESAETVPLINVRDLGDGRVAPLARLEARPVPPGYSVERYRVREGDLVITCRGTQLKIARVTGDAQGAAISSNLIGIRTGRDLLAPVLFAYLESPRGHAALLGHSRSSTLSLALSPTSIGRIEVPVPPLEVQERIADLIRAAEDNHSAAIRAAEQRRAVAREVANILLTGELSSEPPRRI